MDEMLLHCSKWIKCFFSQPNSTILECGDWIRFDKEAVSFQAPLWGIAAMFALTLAHIRGE